MAQLEIGAVFAGHRIEGIAGRGGMGVVYRALQLDLERPVALKLISPELTDDEAFRARFKRESQLAAAIDHPNILPVYQAGEVDAQLFLTTRFVPGTDLRELIAKEGRLDPERAVRVIAQVAAALDAAHARGLVHRDVKPANILLDEGEHVYLTDFGLTKRASSTSGLTKTGQFVGTIDYVSPEQIEGGQADARSDVYSLGCVLFHVLTGSRPYERDTDMAKMFAHVNDPAPAVTALIPGASADADEVIRRALAKTREDRFPSAGDLARAAASAFEHPRGRERAETTIRERSVATGAAAPVPGPTEPMEAPADALTAQTRPVAPEDEATVARRPPETEATATVPDARESPPGVPPPTTARAGSPTRLVALAGAGVLTIALVVIVLASMLAGGDGEEAKEGSRAGAALPPAPVRTSRWRRLPDAPSARQFAATAVARDRIWVLGGLTASGATNEVEVYDPATKAWRSAPSLPIPLHHAMAIPYGDAPAVIGGWVPVGDDRTGRTSGKAYVLRDQTWTALPSLPEPRAAGAVSVVGDTIVVFGGKGADGELLRGTSRFDGRRWLRGAPLPTPREDLAGATEGEFVYAAGGRTRSGASSAAFERYNPRTGSWRRLPGLPTPRAGLGIAIVADQVAAVGGADGDRALGTAEAFDIAGGTWAKLPGLPTPLRGLGVESYRKGLYVTTGATGAGDSSASPLATWLRFAGGRDG